jgi:hypothetical protein
MLGWVVGVDGAAEYDWDGVLLVGVVGVLVPNDKPCDVLLDLLAQQVP